MSGAALAMTATIWVTYRYADRLTQMMGPTGTRTISRISAFLLLCIGVQILITGVEDVLGPLLATRS
jgi:multiple antibiotic resistance protein